MGPDVDNGLNRRLKTPFSKPNVPPVGGESLGREVSESTKTGDPEGQVLKAAFDEFSVHGHGGIRLKWPLRIRRYKYWAWIWRRGFVSMYRRFTSTTKAVHTAGS